ncbi:MAG: 4-hydroxy-tetrahydrodipicolinate reductase, partial [Bacteroidales bacterium]|nr:4-hydroxy-tetrahydrodipicolinate reductase [Bacteroidales bacterium]
FTQPEAFRANYHCLADNFKAVVVGTTGWNDIEDEVKSYFEKVGTPMIYASNYSIGVNVLFAAADFISGLTSRFGGFSANIHEVHHVHKLDAPSGTAKSLAKVVDAHTSVPTEITYERIGEVFGVHTLTFESQCERLSLSHEAYSRQGLAEGAVMAARMTEGLSGVHEFKQLILK